MAFIIGMVCGGVCYHYFMKHVMPKINELKDKWFK